MPEEPGGNRTPGPSWPVVLQVVTAVVVTAVLIAGPQILTFGETLRHFKQRPLVTLRGAPSTPKTVNFQVAQRAQRRGEWVSAGRASAPREPAPGAATTPRRLVKPRRTPAPVPAPVVAAPTPQANPKTYYETLMRQGLELYHAGWYGPAMARFRQASLVMPSITAQLWIGRAAIKAARHAEARVALERVIALAPNSEMAREARALLDTL